MAVSQGKRGEFSTGYNRTSAMATTRAPRRMSLVKVSIAASVASLWLCPAPARGLAGRPGLRSRGPSIDSIESADIPHQARGNPTSDRDADPEGRAVRRCSMMRCSSTTTARRREDIHVRSQLSAPTVATSSSGGFDLAERDGKIWTGHDTIDPKTRVDANPRFLFELRVVGSEWHWTPSSTVPDTATR